MTVPNDVRPGDLPLKRRAVLGALKRGVGAAAVATLLGRDVVLLGVNDRAEVWDATRWREFQDAQNPGFDEMATRAFEGL